MITEEKINILKDILGLHLDEPKQIKLNNWSELFLNYNSHTNLTSKNDIDVLFEKHVFDSLSIVLWEKFKSHKRILDVGTGGGFPSIILAVCFPEKQIIANDSRIKKINFIKEAKHELKLDNLEILYSRIEAAPSQNADLIVSRAVGKMTDIYELSNAHLIKGGGFVIYKAKNFDEEIKNFKLKYKNARLKIIPYKIPLKENYERNLIIFEP